MGIRKGIKFQEITFYCAVLITRQKLHNYTIRIFLILTIPKKEIRVPLQINFRCVLQKILTIPIEIIIFVNPHKGSSGHLLLLLCTTDIVCIIRHKT